MYRIPHKKNFFQKIQTVVAYGSIIYVYSERMFNAPFSDALRFHVNDLSEPKIALSTTLVRNGDVVIGKADHRCQMLMSFVLSWSVVRISLKEALDFFMKLELKRYDRNLKITFIHLTNFWKCTAVIFCFSWGWALVFFMYRPTVLISL